MLHLAGRTKEDASNGKPRTRTFQAEKNRHRAGETDRRGSLGVAADAPRPHAPTFRI